MENKKQTVHMVSLGCPKNRVDSEVMLGHLFGDGYRHVEDAEGADLVIVNTCGFIDAAKEESIDTILEMEELKKSGQCKKLVVAGCLSQRYAPELAKEMPDVDHFIGTGNFESLPILLDHDNHVPASARPRSLPIIEDLPRLRGKNALKPFRHSEIIEGREIYIPDPDFTIRSDSPRVATQPSFATYLKISEGCSNTCSFCIIPKLRGAQRSRTIDDIVHEFQAMLDAGAVEITLIAQDLCAYGKDLAERTSLAKLLRALDKVADDCERQVWIRCMYAYPRGLTREVIEVMGNSRHILPYLDMPLQHISDSMLRRMRRGKGGDSTLALLRRLREAIPNLVLRTTFITGLPGETEEEFAELCEVVREIKFERLGVFVFSPEEGTPAADMLDQVPREVAESRRDVLMEIQQEVSHQHQRDLIGKRIMVLVEGSSDETDLLLQGRHVGQAPEIDGVTYINNGNASPGDLVEILVEDATDYDVVGGIETIVQSAPLIGV